MNICSQNHTHLIGTDGGLRHISSPYLVPELEKQGWRIVVNPKREYYPEYDTTHPSYTKNQTIETENLDILQGEML